MNKKYIRAREVAEYMSIGKSTVWWLCKQKKLTPIKFSPRITMFSIEEVDKLVNSVPTGESYD